MKLVVEIITLSEHCGDDGRVLFFQSCLWGREPRWFVVSSCNDSDWRAAFWEGCRLEIKVFVGCACLQSQIMQFWPQDARWRSGHQHYFKVGCMQSASGGNSLIIIDVIDAGDSWWCRLWGFIAAIVVCLNKFFIEFIPLLNEVRSDGRGNHFHNHWSVARLGSLMIVNCGRVCSHRDSCRAVA